MAVLRHGEMSRNGAGLVALDLGDLHREAERMRAHATAEAQRLVREGAIERDRLVAGAREAGRAEGIELGRVTGIELGRAEGIAARAAELQKLEQGWAVALGAFAADRERLVSCARADVVSLALAIGERVLRRAIAADPKAVEGPLAAVLAQVMRPSRVNVRVHPEDAAIARAALPGVMARFGNVEHADISEDATLERGSCVMQTPGGGAVDASIATQLERVAAALLPEKA